MITIGTLNIPILKNIITQINDETLGKIEEIRGDIKTHEIAIYNKWKNLYKQCNPVDYLLNSSNILHKSKCLQDCYDHIRKFSIFIQNNYDLVLKKFNLYDSYVNRLENYSESSDALGFRLNYIESEVVESIEKFLTFVMKFVNLGLLHVSSNRIYKLSDFILDFTEQSLKLPTLKLNDTIDDLTIYITQNKINSTVGKVKTGVINSTASSTDMTTTQYDNTNNSDKASDTQPSPIADTEGGLVDLDLDLEAQFEVMMQGGLRKSTNAKPPSISMESPPLLNTNDIDDILDYTQVIEYNNIIYDKLLLDLESPSYDIMYDDEVKKYVVMICKYLRNMYYNESIPEQKDFIKITLPEYLRKTFKAVGVCGDGSCFYNAISVQLIGNTSLANVLRTIIVYHMKLNKWWLITYFYINLNDNKTFEQLIRDSLLSSTYVDGGYAPVMMSIILNKNINIYGYKSGTYLRINLWVFHTTKNHRTNQEIYLYLDNNHYSALELWDKNTLSNIPYLTEYQVDAFSDFITLD
uniref:Vrtn protein n=1 Tax=Fopius arisanus TaxID=64838 RepID=A0A0C9RH44_9HYME